MSASLSRTPAARPALTPRAGRVRGQVYDRNSSAPTWAALQLRLAERHHARLVSGSAASPVRVARRALRHAALAISFFLAPPPVKGGAAPSAPTAPPAGRSKSRETRGASRRAGAGAGARAKTRDSGAGRRGSGDEGGGALREREVSAQLFSIMGEAHTTLARAGWRRAGMAARADASYHEEAAVRCLAAALALHSTDGAQVRPSAAGPVGSMAPRCQRDSVVASPDGEPCLDTNGLSRAMRVVPGGTLSGGRRCRSSAHPPRRWWRRAWPQRA